ncbi:MAG TPA: hypothetical protein VL860_09105 [Planctomycetota bacterium]|nr:hypothetical protein [Planctomycetota bacterium]
MDYLKPLIWVLLIVILALGLHLVLELVEPVEPDVEAPTIGNGAVQTTVSPATPNGSTQAVPPPLTPTRATPTPVPTPAVTPTPAPPVTPAVLPVPTASGIDRVSRDQWEKALLANGFITRAHPGLHAADASYSSYAYLVQNREAAWAFLQAGQDNLVVRLEFYVDGRDSAQGVQAADDAAKGCVQIIKSFRALDKSLGDLSAPVLYSPYSGKNAFAAGNGFSGYARDVGRYICIRATPRKEIPLGEFLLLWKDPAGKVGALQNSVAFADQCKDVDWNAMPVPPEAK